MPHMPKRQITYSNHSTHAARSAHAKGERQFRTYDTSMIQPKAPAGPAIFGIVLAVVLACVLIFGIVSCSRGCSSDSETVADGTQVTFTVESGASTSDIAQTLVDNKLIARASDFTDAVKSQNEESALKPGTYTIAGGTSVSDIIAQLVAGPTIATVTVPEGYTVERVAQAVSDATGGSISADDFTACANNASAYTDDYPFVADAYNNSLEGFLFPKTYQITGTDTADSLVRKMLSQYQSETSSLDYSYAQSQGLSQYDVLKLASVVERESDANVRGKVASVFYNRLAQNMPLQSDATIAYVVGHDPTHDDLSVDSPYNTYTNNGLPAGPICSPGLDSLKAACSPESTGYLYFYFTQNGDGSMNYYFSETYEQHQQAINGQRDPDVVGKATDRDGSASADSGNNQASSDNSGNSGQQNGQDSGQGDQNQG